MSKEKIFLKQETFCNWDSFHARLNSHYKTWSYSTRKRSTKKLKHTGNLSGKSLQLKGVC